MIDEFEVEWSTLERIEFLPREPNFRFDILQFSVGQLVVLVAEEHELPDRPRILRFITLDVMYSGQRFPTLDTSKICLLPQRDPSRGGAVRPLLT